MTQPAKAWTPPPPREVIERELRAAQGRADDAAHTIVRLLHGQRVQSDQVQRQRSVLREALLDAAVWKRAIAALDDLEKQERG